MNNLLIVFILLISIGVSILLLKIVVESIKGKGNWGINANVPNCPDCDVKAPFVRTPTSIRQALWGGWTCSNCGCELDKWGKEINSAKSQNTIES